MSIYCSKFIGRYSIAVDVPPDKSLMGQGSQHDISIEIDLNPFQLYHIGSYLRAHEVIPPGMVDIISGVLKTRIRLNFMAKPHVRSKANFKPVRDLYTR